MGSWEPGAGLRGQATLSIRSLVLGTGRGLFNTPGFVLHGDVRDTLGRYPLRSPCQSPEVRASSVCECEWDLFLVGFRKLLYFLFDYFLKIYVF